MSKRTYGGYTAPELDALCLQLIGGRRATRLEEVALPIATSALLIELEDARALRSDYGELKARQWAIDAYDIISRKLPDWGIEIYQTIEDTTEWRYQVRGGAEQRAASLGLAFIAAIEQAGVLAGEAEPPYVRELRADIDRLEREAAVNRVIIKQISRRKDGHE